MKTQFLVFGLLLTILSTYSQVTRMHGLAIVCDFNDFQYAISDETIDSLINQRSNYNRSGNAGSLYEFFKDQTNNQYEITHKVIRLRFSLNESFYKANNNILLDSIMARLRTQFPNGISGLTTKSNGGISSWLVLQRYATVAWGLGSSRVLQSDGRNIIMDHVAFADLGGGTEQNHRVRLMAHEASHSIFLLPDVGNPKRDMIYRVNGHAGSYCMMGWNAGATNSAVDYCAPILETFKTSIVVDIVPTNVDRVYNLKSNAKDTLYRFRNPNNPNEYFLFQALNYSKWFPQSNAVGHPMHTGLSIWHVIHGISTDSKNPWMRIVQADGLDLMNMAGVSTHVATGTDNRIFFGSQVRTVNGHINPLFRWIDGSIPALHIENISSPGQRMTFTVKGVNRLLSTSVLSGFGTVDPLGYSILQNGESKTVNIIPEWGHEIEDVFVNGVSQGAINSYNIDANSNEIKIEASFRFTHPKISPFAPGALWRVYSVSSVDGTNVATRAFDNNFSTHWTSNENDNYNHEIVVNLGSLYSLSGIALQLRQGFAGSFNIIGEYEIYTSIDAENWQLIRNVKTFNPSTFNYRIASFNQVLARYIKIKTLSVLAYSKRASISEIEAYGVRVVNNSVLTDAEISKSGWRIHGVSSQDASRPATNLIDGNASTAWHTQLTPLLRRYPHNIDIDFGTNYNITRFRILPNSLSTNARIAKFALFVSNDGVNWGDTLVTATWLNTADEKVVYFQPTNARYLRIQGLSEAANNASASASEIYVHGSIATSVDNLIQNDNVRVFAANQHIFVESDNHISNVDVVDAMGRLMYSNQNFGSKNKIDISFHSGVYIVRTIVNNDKVYKKVVVN